MCQNLFFQHIQGTMPDFAYSTESRQNLIMITSLSSGTIMFSNVTPNAVAELLSYEDLLGTLESTISPNTTNEADLNKEENQFPFWIEPVMAISHLALAINCSVNFAIYYLKRRAFSNQGK